MVAAQAVCERAIILGASRGVRRLDASRSAPTALQASGARGTVLDWTLHALRSHAGGEMRVTYVGGYQIQKVLERYPSLEVRYHAGWKEAGELAALLKAEPVAGAACLIVRSGTLMAPEAMERLNRARGDLIVGEAAPDAAERFLGVVKLSGARVEKACAVARRLLRRNPQVGLADWVEALAREGWRRSRVNLDGAAAPITDQLALARTVFGSKARTLERIKPLITRAVVLEQVRFSADEWVRDPQRIMTAVTRAFGERPVVVRSSAHAEDGHTRSCAGRFRSVLDVPANDPARVREAVAEVTDSFIADGRRAHSADEVFIQPQVRDLAASGVLLTRDLETGAPYYVLNIDRRSGRSDTVTSGCEEPYDTIYISRRADPERLPHDLGTCVAVGRELEALMHLQSLDIEFGIDRAGHAYLFQVRPITARSPTFELADEDLHEELDRITEFLEGHLRPHPHLFGETTLFGTMPDWNPAEMIGTAPRPLALSLYQRLIGDRAWAAARAQIGYRDVRPEPLIVALGGRPYVDVRASLNSFLPDGLEPELGARWVEHGLAMLKSEPHLHDKIEFEVAITCLTFDADAQARRLAAAGLTGAQISRFRKRLLALTDGVLVGRLAPIAAQQASLSRLSPRRARLVTGREALLPTLARSLHHLLEDCEGYGLVPFSILARYAFISIALLQSLRACGVFSQEEYETILRSIPTVAGELSRDLRRLAAGELSTERFLARYGHLRPSSYDITSPSYAAAPELYLGQSGGSAAPCDGARVEAAAELFEQYRAPINRLLRELGFTCRAAQLRDFIVGSIPAREEAKFEFMKNVDAALGTIAALSEQMGLTPEEASYLTIERWSRFATNSPSGAAGVQLRREVEFAKKRWNLTCAIRLPHLITSTRELEVFQLEEWTPNFVSTRRVVAPPVVLEGRPAGMDLGGRIVLIRAADPGYDWIFGHAIAGLITQYGGVASHMAIRAAEFGLPAAVGCGERIFERLRGARLIELDCAHRTVRAIE